MPDGWLLMQISADSLTHLLESPEIFDVPLVLSRLIANTPRMSSLLAWIKLRLVTLVSEQGS